MFYKKDLQAIQALTKYMELRLMIQNFNLVLTLKEKNI